MGGKGAVGASKIKIKFMKLRLNCSLFCFVALSVPHVVFFSLSFADDEIKIPDINIFGDDLSIYGISGMRISAHPAGDKEKYIPEKLRGKTFFETSSSGRGTRISLSAGNQWNTSAAAAFTEKGEDFETGFYAGFNTKYLSRPGLRRADGGFDYFYKITSPAEIKIEPAFSKKVHQTPSSGGNNFSLDYFETPLAVRIPNAQIFAEFKMKPQMLRGRYPSGFYNGGGDASLVSQVFALNGDARAQDFLVSARGEFSLNDWDWIDGNKNFKAASADVSVSKNVGASSVMSSLKSTVRAGKCYYLAALSAAVPAGKHSMLEAGISPEISNPEIRDFTARSGVILKEFPGTSHDNYKNLFAQYSRSSGKWGLNLKFSHRETQNYLYSDENSALYGVYETKYFRRMELVTTASFTGGDFNISCRGVLKKYSGEVIVPKALVSLYGDYSFGKCELNVLVAAVSRTSFFSECVKNSVKIWYNLKSDFRLFFIVDNALGEKIYYSRYDAAGVTLVSAGVEAKF